MDKLGLNNFFGEAWTLDGVPKEFVPLNAYCSLAPGSELKVGAQAGI